MAMCSRAGVVVVGEGVDVADAPVEEELEELLVGDLADVEGLAGGGVDEGVPGVGVAGVDREDWSVSHHRPSA
jgi:hypothetical protein